MFYGYIVDVVAHCLKWPFKASLMVEFTQVIILCGFCNELQLKNTCRLSLFFSGKCCLKATLAISHFDFRFNFMLAFSYSVARVCTLALFIAVLSIILDIGQTQMSPCIIIFYCIPK